MTKKNSTKQERQILRLPRLPLILGLIVLIGLIVFVVLHVRDTERFLTLIKNAKPAWLLLVIVFQMGTYTCVGAIWYTIVLAAGYQVSLGQLAKLSIEKLSIDQLIPAIGMSGNLVAYQSMKRLGIPKKLSMEAILLNVLSHYMAYALVAVVSLLLLWHGHHLTPVFLSLAGLFSIILILVPAAVLWLIANKNRQWPAWVLRIKPIAKAQKVIRQISPQRIYSPVMLTKAGILNLLIFLLDSASLWACLHSIGLAAKFIPAFIALVVASVGATLSALPGGIGGFETGSVTILTILGIPMEGALAGTILLRGFTLWLPLIPGLWFARKDIIVKW